MNDAKALWKAIAANPGEDTPKLALADWYQENGEPRMGYALRWCVARKKWPGGDVGRARGRVYWFRMAGPPGRHNLHPRLFDAVRLAPTDGFRSTRHGTVEAAVRELARALAKLRAVCEVPAA